MSYSAKILKDSISHKKTRLVTFEVTFPRIVLAEFNTHKLFSRNSASSRAIPIQKMLKMVQENPYVPEKWGKNQKGMQAYEDLLPEAAIEAEKEWLKARDLAVEQVEKLLTIGVHKQTTNRLLEPFMWHTVIVTATELDNFFHLRNHKEAHPAIQKPAKLMEEALQNSTSEFLDYEEWHTPLLNIGMDNEDEQIRNTLGAEGLLKVSVGRCARVSYLTHDGARDFNKDIELHDRLLASGHLSPAEHVATPYDPANEEHVRIAMTNMLSMDSWFGNFKNWVQYRKLIPGEFDILGYRAKK